MSNLNSFQRFMDSTTKRSKMELPNSISAILDFCEYNIQTDFNQKDKSQYRSKNRKKQLVKQFPLAFATLARQQKIEYYCSLVDCIFNFTHSNFQFAKSEYTGIIHTVGYSRSFSIKRWKEKKIRLDLDKQLMFAEREERIKSYDMRNYLLRKSKNKDYFSFVLQAINNVPTETSMTVHIGFTEQKKFNQWIKAIRYCVDKKQCQYLLQLYKVGGVNKSMGGRMFASDNKHLSQSMVEQDQLRKDTMDQQANYLEEDKQKMAVSMVFLAKQSDTREKQQPEIIGESNQKNYDEIVEQVPLKREIVHQNVQKISVSDQNLKERLKLQQEIQQFQSIKPVGKTIVDELIEGESFQELDLFEQKIEEEKEQQKQSKKHLDLFHKLYAEYQLEELQMYTNFQLVHQSQRLKIYQHGIIERRLKMVITFEKQKTNRQQILSILSKPQKAHLYNDNIESVQLKTFIPSQNSALIYQVNKPYNRLYRARDFVFIRHVFNDRNRLYMIDKSIENTNYPPFMTIVRGSLCIVYGIYQRASHFQLIADFQVQNQGLINPVQQTNLTLKYLKGFNKLVQSQIPRQSYKFFQLDWDISKNQANKIENEIRFRKKTISMIDKQHQIELKTEEAPVQQRKFIRKQHREGRVQVVRASVSPKQERSVQSHSHDESPQNYREKSLSPIHQPTSADNSANVSPQTKKGEIKTFDPKSVQEIGQINDQEPRNQPLFYLTVIRKLDKEGLIIKDNSFCSKKYRVQPLLEHQIILNQGCNGHPIWRGEWVHDDKEGGMIFINKKKIEDQKGVLKFLISKIAKNLLSGQSITQISLPVDIFGHQSNLQRLMYSMAYAPLLFQKMQKENMLQRLLKAVIFGLSNSLLFISMEKPFNPIIGETFQCWINGCPGYAQQISHHPPIGAFIFKGRGYDITAQIESKISLGLNTGTGINDGIYRIKFDDGIQICFMTPGGELAGLTAGERKFNIVGKSYYWISNTNIMLQIAFDPSKKGFFSVGKQNKPVDYFEGTVWEVKPEFMAKFVAGKRREPEEKQRIKDYGKISGIWSKNICYNDGEIWNFDRQLPITMEYEANPLPSDGNWREDILYRRKNEVTRAQIQKQRLQVLQRKDRKFRENFNKKK